MYFKAAFYVLFMRSEAWASCRLAAKRPQTVSGWESSAGAALFIFTSVEESVDWPVSRVSRSAFLKLSGLFGDKDGMTVETGDEGTLYLVDEACLCQWVTWAPLSLCRLMRRHTLIFFFPQNTHIFDKQAELYWAMCSQLGAHSRLLIERYCLCVCACVGACVCVRPRMRVEPSNKVHNWENWWGFNEKTISVSHLKRVFFHTDDRSRFLFFNLSVFI